MSCWSQMLAWRSPWKLTSSRLAVKTAHMIYINRSFHQTGYSIQYTISPLKQVQKACYGPQELLLRPEALHLPQLRFPLALKALRAGAQLLALALLPLHRHLPLQRLLALRLILQGIELLLLSPQLPLQAVGILPELKSRALGTKAW